MNMGVVPWPRNLKGVPLNEDEADRYARTAGTLSHQMLMPLVTKPGFSNLPRGIQMMEISSLIERSHEAAARTVFPQFPHLLTDAVQVKRNMVSQGRGTAGVSYLQ
jgi:hypothetical protein